MALAVAEAHRVLRPGGLLLDIHPAGAPMRLEVWYRRRDRPDTSQDDQAAYDRVPLGPFEPDETIDDFTASTGAIAAAAGQGFTGLETLPFDYCYVFDSLDELTDYLKENDELDLASDALLERALLALRDATTPARLAVAQPVLASRLQKA